MDRDYMLQSVRHRIKELQEKYREYFDTDNGPSRSVSGAACIRSRITKDLGVLKLIEYLLVSCSSKMIIDNDELCRAFDRLVEPRKLR